MRGPNSLFATLASNVRRLRKERGLTQARLAELADMSLTGLQRLESCERWPRPATAEAIAAALGVAPHRLFTPPGAHRPPLLECLLVLSQACRVSPRALARQLQQLDPAGGSDPRDPAEPDPATPASSPDASRPTPLRPSRGSGHGAQPLSVLVERLEEGERLLIEQLVQLLARHDPDDPL